ncbi:hypothetical protein PG993_000278 [Apiospora rasikravindrae]|uniref:Aminoglycoside phosphotransferase domain-containing protein n=1 Tax=Apiospora rasikravindrae TaxID=990691 RepID=A0ABR1U827_9PEZI
MSVQTPSSAESNVIIPDERDIVCPNADDYRMSFEERRPKILEVCRAFWPDANHELTRIEPERKHTDSLSYPVDITHDNGGSFDEFVIYLPLDVDMTAGHAAMLKAMAQLEEVESLVPKVLHVDITDENPLNYPYMLQKRIPGRRVAGTFDDMTQEQKVLLAAELGRTYRRIQSVRRDFSGIYELTDEDIDNAGINQPLPSMKLTRYGIVEEGWRNFSWDEVRDSIKEDDSRKQGQVLTRSNFMEDTPGMTARENLLLIFERRIQRNRYLESHEWENDYLEPALKIVREIVEKESNAGVFPSSTCDICLNNPAILSPQNVLVDFDDEGKPVITGIVEWSYAEFVPHFLACPPPEGFWTFGPAYRDESDSDSDSEDESDDEDADCYMPYRELLDGDQPFNVAGVQVKHAFDEAVGEAFRVAACTPDIVFARRYFAVAACQGWWTCDPRELRKLAKEWHGRKLSSSSSLQIEEEEEDDSEEDERALTEMLNMAGCVLSD